MCASDNVKMPRPPGRMSVERMLWAIHPNKTTRKLRKFLVCWERLGAFLSDPGSSDRRTPASEKSFLKTKIEIARSIEFLKFIEGVGNVGIEASAREAEFTRILEKCPSLTTALNATDSERRELYHSWHSLYLFLHTVLGSSPYEVAREDAALRYVPPVRSRNPLDE